VAPTSADRFREGARAWLSQHLPGAGSAGSEADLATAKAFQAALCEAGYAGITWPKRWGGQGLGQAEQQAFAEEAESYALPTGVFNIGMGMCGPTLIDHGTDEQRKRYIRPLLRGDDIWCQLFSEPGAGSDVASLQTRAVLDGATWVVNGQKVWTSDAQRADFGALLARTDVDVPKHRGLTMFILDMRQPGVTVRPLVDMTGQAPFNEVYLDDVRLAASAVIGEVNGGWRVAMTMLGHERMLITSLRHRRSAQLRYAALAARARRIGVSTDPGVRVKLAELYAYERVRDLFAARLREDAAAGRPPGARGSVGKLSGALLIWRAVQAAGEIAGPGLIAWPEGDGAEVLARNIAAAPASSIAGGTNDIQRSIIAERILGLPKEPQVDRELPFRALRVGTQAAPVGRSGQEAGIAPDTDR
jgi:alkylation response protein AidB-like acyl-CoA dehydrogenase